MNGYLVENKIKISSKIGSVKLQDGVKDVVHNDQELRIPAKLKHSIKDIVSVDSIIYLGYKKIDS